MFIGLHVKYPLFLQILMKLELSRFFFKLLKYQTSATYVFTFTSF